MVSEDTTSKEFAEAVYMLQKELSLTHEDIFGGQQVVVRDGESHLVDLPGMNVKTFLTYLQLMKEYAEEQERHRKKQEMRQSFSGY